MGDFKKTVRIGLVPYTGDPALRAHTYCSIKWEDGRLSISGVVGPKTNGDASGGCGQIDGNFAHEDPAEDDTRYTLIKPSEISFADGWDEETWYCFLHIWKAWHLNDMRAYCEHQGKLGWPKLAREQVTLYRWTLDTDTSRAQQTLKRQAMAKLESGEATQLTGDQIALLALDYYRITFTDEAPPGYVLPSSTIYGHKETKALGWLRPEEHPDGLLMKPCPECGYRYGSEWKREDVPDEVIEWLQALPDADRQPAWV